MSDEAEALAVRLRELAVRITSRHSEVVGVLLWCRDRLKDDAAYQDLCSAIDKLGLIRQEEDDRHH